MNTLRNFLNGFTKLDISDLNDNFVQYIRNECNQTDIYNLLSEYKGKKMGSDESGLYVTTFRIDNVLNYKKVIITFQRGIYKSNRHLNCTVVNLFK